MTLDGHNTQELKNVIIIRTLLLKYNTEVQCSCSLNIIMLYNVFSIVECDLSRMESVV